MKGMKLGSGPQVRKLPSPQKGNGTPFMAEHLEEALTGGPSTRPHLRDSDMSAFNKLVSSMKASGTLPSHPKTNKNNVSILFYADCSPTLYCQHYQSVNILSEVMSDMNFVLELSVCTKRSIMLSDNRIMVTYRFDLSYSILHEGH